MILRYTTLHRRIFTHTSQRCSQTSTPPQVNTTTEVQFDTVYNFPHIRLIAAIKKAKVVATIASGLIIPVCGVLSTAGLFSTDAFYIASYIGVSNIAAFSLLNLWTKNVIGFLYVSKDGRQIKISYVDYWGQRQNLIVPANDWTPILNLPIKNSNYLYITPHITNNSICLKLMKQFGGVTDKEKMGYYFE